MDLKVDFPCEYKLVMTGIAEVPSSLLTSCPLHGTNCPPNRVGTKDGERTNEHKQVLADLVAAIDRCMPTWETLASFAFTHDLNYPPEVISIEKELGAARELLSKDGENNG